MDFEDTPEEAAFRAEARAFLETHARPKGPDTVTAYGSPDANSPEEAAHVREAQAWQATLYDGGWAGITWPKESGGRGGTAIQSIIFSQEQSRFDVPTGVFAQGIGMAGPTLIQHGTHEQQERFLAPMLRGDEIWCQLFSEPGAGSDLAGLSTRAVLDGDEYVVNGQKVWTSGAHYSQYGILLARTDPDKPKHRGITYFLLDMKTPGIEVRPLRQPTGVAHFNEVFLTDVRIPVANVVGPVNEGWRVTMTTLTAERTLIGALGNDVFPDLCHLARRFGRSTDPVVRQELAATYIRLQTIKYLGWRVQTAVSQGRSAGPESSVIKLAFSRHIGQLGDFGNTLQGASGMLWDRNDHELAIWMQRFLGQWSSRIGGGTEQIQRNIIGERVLGLPKEPAVDRDVPFKSLARG
jgi:alkylation response protein AidB-like acyl-CoA dehydrogenase